MNFILVEITDIWYIISSDTNRRWSLSCCTCSRWYSICCRWKWWYTFIKRQTSIGVIEKEKKRRRRRNFLSIFIQFSISLYMYPFNPYFKQNSFTVIQIQFWTDVSFYCTVHFSFAHLSYTYVCRKYIQWMRRHFILLFVW